MLFIGKASAQTDVKIAYGNNNEAGNYKQINGNLVLMSFFNDPFNKTSSVELFTSKK